MRIILVNQWESNETWLGRTVRIFITHHHAFAAVLRAHLCTTPRAVVSVTADQTTSNSKGPPRRSQAGFGPGVRPSEGREAAHSKTENDPSKSRKT